MEVIKITKEQELYQLKNIWNELLSKSMADTIFLTWEWVTNWWKNYKKDKSLFILIIKGNKEIVGIAPFYKTTFPFLHVFYIESLNFIGDTHYAEYLDFIIKKGKEKETLLALFEYFKKENWDIINLKEIPETSSTLVYLPVFSNNLNFTFIKEKHTCGTTIFPNSFEDFLKILKPRFRTKIRSILRKWENNSRIKFYICNKSNLEKNLKSLFKLHQKRWLKKGFEGSFNSPTNRKFFYDLSLSFLEKDWLRLYSLELDGKPIAYQFCFLYKNKLYLLQEGFEIDLKEIEPGNVLRTFVFKDAIKIGIKEYDFLGGLSRHKISWGAQAKYNCNITIARPYLKAHLYAHFPTYKEKIKDVIRSLIPQKFLDLKKQWIESRKKQKIKILAKKWGIN